MGVYIINKKKYDTNKMELISNKFRYEYEVNHPIFGGFTCVTYDTGLYKSKNGNWLVVFDGHGRAVTEKKLRICYLNTTIRHMRNSLAS